MIVPVQAQYLPLTGVAHLVDTIKLVKERFNEKLEIGGIVLTFFDERRNLDNDVQEILERSKQGHETTEGER